MRINESLSGKDCCANTNVLTHSLTHLLTYYFCFDGDSPQGQKLAPRHQRKPLPRSRRSP